MTLSALDDRPNTFEPFFFRRVPGDRKDPHFRPTLNIITFMCRKSDTKFSVLRAYDLLN